MTRCLATDSNNDLYIGGDGNLAVASGIQAVLTACACAAKARLGEMVLSANQGVPYFETAFSGGYNVALFEDALRATLLRVPDVRSVDLQVAASGDRITYTAIIVTTYGEGVLRG